VFVYRGRAPIQKLTTRMWHRECKAVGLEGVTLVRCLPLLPTIKLVVGHSGGAIARQAGVALFAVQKTLASLEGIGLVDVERGPVENRYRLNTRHHLVAHGLRALFGKASGTCRGCSLGN
jgi:hypothetical protein